jgi:hypothetical protein
MMTFTGYDQQIVFIAHFIKPIAVLHKFSRPPLRPLLLRLDGRVDRHAIFLISDWPQ